METVICVNIKNQVGLFKEYFQLVNGEKFFVKVITRTTNGRQHEAKITLEFNNCLNLLIRANIFCDTGTSFYQKTEVIKSSKCAVFSSFLHPSNATYKVLLRMTLWKDLENYDPSLPFNSRNPPVASPTRTEPVVGKKHLFLSMDLKKLLQSSYLSDIVLTDETSEIRAHKLILSARSPVFAKMLQHEMRENLENVVIIKDFSMDVMKKLLDFIYSGEVVISDFQMACSLYVASDKYDIKGLKEVCSKMMMNVDLDNVLEIIILADLYGDSLLKQAALNFIYVNYSQVKALNVWDSFLKERQSLAIEVLSSVLDKK